ncbi:hypothetical protein HU200_035064 [Digitaria exilis]|uniref:C2H2-type domain-containing protein n=1 Tax=Digitaria exilis TaxID=1010633 RepID=A0A835BIJ7_9POAL|nr:hypothetical protein HU200_035064 [Digitaria exilis]CAB3495588.1 unnamed protein product [Digitaria exilis]
MAVLSRSSATRHSCKVCRKGFPCGRSLGGHMRSHSLAEMETAMVEDDADDDGDHHRRASDYVMPPGAGGYGLRENPKKTRRLSGLHGGDESSGGGDHDECVHGAPVVGHERRHAPAGVAVEFEADRDHHQEEDTLLMPAPRRRRRSMRVPAPAPPQHAAAFEKEPEDVALCLIMLSRDILERRDSTADYLSPEKKKRRKKRHDHHHHDDADYSDDFFNYTAADVEINTTKMNKTKHNNHRVVLADDDYHHDDADFDSPAPPRRRYECPGCGRAFQSYQALGGHRASHKRINSNCSIAKVPSDDHTEPSVKTQTSMPSSDAEYGAADVTKYTTVVALKAKPHKDKAMVKFECPICFKVFGSGQALGGHKRSHSIAGELYEPVHAAEEDVGIEQPMIADGFLDLNLPAPGAED